MGGAAGLCGNPLRHGAEHIQLLGATGGGGFRRFLNN
jgi:hypothetical protein